MLHVLLVWILDTLHHIDCEEYLVHHMPTSSRCAVMMLSINLMHFVTRCEHSHLYSHNIKPLEPLVPINNEITLICLVVRDLTLYVPLCVGRSKGKAGLQLECIPVQLHK